MRLFFATLIAMLALPGAHGQTLRLHVAPQGSAPSHSGRQPSFDTLDKALEEVTRRAPEAPGDICVLVHDGVHRLENPLMLGGAHIPPTGRLIIEAADGAAPVISGGRLITGWKTCPDGTLLATIPAVKAGDWTFRGLFVNGRRRPRARHPNQGWARVADALPDRRSGFTFAPGAIPSSAGAAGLELLFLHDWSTTRVPVASLDAANRRLTVAHPIGPQAPHYKIDHFEKHPRFTIENDPALMDSPGEWYLDPQAGTLAYRPMPGETAANINVVAPIATSLLEVRGRIEAPVRRITVRGLTFSHCTWTLPAGGYAAGQATFHEDRATGEGNEIRQRVPAAITFEDAVECMVERCRVSKLETSAIAFAGRTVDCALVGCVIEDVGGNGVILGEDTTRLIDGSPWWKAAPDQASRRLEVTNNVVQRCGTSLPGAVGIWIGIAHHVRVTHNLVRHQPYTGISVGWRWSAEPTPCHHNTIAHNHIHHVMQVLSDGGGIYTLGLQPGTTLHRNHIHDVPLNAGRAGSNGMFLDQGTTDMVVSNNVIHSTTKSALRFHLVVGVEVRDNILATVADASAYRYNATDPKVVIRKRNTVLEQERFDLGDRMVAAAIAGCGLEAAYRDLAR